MSHLKIAGRLIKCFSRQAQNFVAIYRKAYFFVILFIHRRSPENVILVKGRELKKNLVMFSTDKTNALQAY